MKARIAAREREKAEITAPLAEAPAGFPDVHPGIVAWRGPDPSLEDCSKIEIIFVSEKLELLLG